VVGEWDKITRSIHEGEKGVCDMLKRLGWHDNLQRGEKSYCKLTIYVNSGYGFPYPGTLGFAVSRYEAASGLFGVIREM
jgi:hypothetical protein